MNTNHIETLFHYTPTFENLLGILENGFRFSILKEDLPLRGFSNSPFSIPGVINYYKESSVICFCDIPLKEIEAHTIQYGKYGLGLEKEWCMGAGISPIRYFHYDTPDLQNNNLMSALTLFRALNEGYRPVQMVVQSLNEAKELINFTKADFDNLPAEAIKIIEMLEREYIKSMSYITFQLDYLRAYSGKWKDRETGQTVDRIFFYENEWRATQTDPKTKYLQFPKDAITHVFVKTDEEIEKIISLSIPDIQNKLFLISELNK